MTTELSTIIDRAHQELPRINPDAPFLYHEQSVMSYRKLGIWTEAISERIHAQLNSAKEQPTIALIAEPTERTLTLIAAAWLQGWVLVPLSPDSSLAALKDRLASVSVDLLITDQVEPLIPGLSKPCIDLINLPDPLDVSYDDAQLWSASEWEERRFCQPNQLFGFFFTSGTTGRPKGVPLRRVQMLSASLDADATTRPEVGEAWLHGLPINHIGGYSLVLRSLMYGSAVYPQPNGFDRDTFAHLLSEDQRITVTSLVPTMLRRLLDDQKFAVHEQFKSILMGGAPTTPELIREAVERDIPLTVSYGMTETCAQIAAHPFRDRFDLEDPLDTVGFPFESNNVSIRLDLSDPAAQDGNGQIWLRGPQVITEYLDPADTQNAFDEDGWFNTGDLGQMDHEGRLYIATRRSDMIISGGENIRPQRVERAILDQLENIDECVVLGQDDPEWGQRVIALCVLRKDTSELPYAIDEFRYRLGEVLEKFELPRAVGYVQALPKTASGKIKKFELLDRLQNNEITIDAY